jgi:hypothetical protein
MCVVTTFCCYLDLESGCYVIGAVDGLFNVFVFVLGCYTGETINIIAG